ncbi:polyhydroxyalkanoic acid system family protein [Terrimonas pollutisoli]|uniref:polyhydroxyalkanoic acid system family protein n=1 Tax=Terrimonas pollutisoli TaxID=3034147 RepID=UPI0023EC805A|nr:polyhydroxyalkanoic acid system family protein [Terrimonas sp. H1YJ31]
MATLDISIPHQLTPQEALSRIQGLLQQLQRDQADTIKDVKETWDGNEGEFSFSAKGFDLSGKIKVEENFVHIDGNLPFALSFFKGKISEVIKEKAGVLLSNN